MKKEKKRSGAGRWTRRFRRMRVYNPRATFEQAELIAELFKEYKHSSKKKCNEAEVRKKMTMKESVEYLEDQTANIVSMPDDVLLKIFDYAVNTQALEELYSSLGVCRFAARERISCKVFYRLLSVCRRFRNFGYKFYHFFSRPPIGLRLQRPSSFSPLNGGSVVAYTYGDSTSGKFCKHVPIHEVPDVIFPGQICTFIIIKHMVITDHLMDMLLNLDLSKVEELFWHDIQGLDATDFADKMQRLLSKMPELQYAEFYSSNLDPTTIFPDSNCYWEDLGLERKEFKISLGGLRKRYRRLKQWRFIRVARTLQYITVDYVNDCFFIFSEEDLSQLREKWRMVAQSAVSSGNQAPYILAPEQVTLLILYGAARVRESSKNFGKSGTLDSVLCGPPQMESEQFVDRTSQGVEAQLAKTQEKVSNDLERTIVHLIKIEEDDSLFRWLDDFEVPVPCTRDFRARELVYHDLWRKGYYLTSGQQFGCTYLAYEGMPGDVHATFLVDFVLDDVKFSPLEIVSLIRLATQVKKNLVIAIVASDSHLPHYIKFDWLKPYTDEREELPFNNGRNF
ncbi:hypothetical protein KIN20_012055 [Parelaphostrongylus tenuis]|uniref:tRNA-intron lyase n=1 Tax=Parelaphostrongylus tenuis TaxID=148309 RepID=A0AAD5QQA0_PARTN|nr:hypothetical protein KIN20_012055 [Parelaphostrongylus tenuis]